MPACTGHGTLHDDQIAFVQVPPLMYELRADSALLLPRNQCDSTTEGRLRLAVAFHDARSSVALQRLEPIAADSHLLADLELGIG